MNLKIQMLRGIAIVYICLLHSTFMWSDKCREIYFSHFDTASGVELFFIISGYFCMKKLSAMVEQNDYCRYLDYVKKRFFRLAPLIYFWGGAVTIIGYFNPALYGEFKQLMYNFAGTILWIRNFQEINSPTQFGYFWAVSLQFQFFVIMALLCFIAKNNKNVILTLFSTFVLLSFYRPGVLQCDYFRLDSLVLGALIYFFTTYVSSGTLENIKKFNWCSNIFKLFSFYILLIILALGNKVLVGYPNFHYTVVSLLAGAIFLIAIYRPDVISTGIDFLDQLLIKIGNYSYSIYVSHIILWWIGMDITTRIGIESTFYKSVVMLLCMISGAYLSKKFIEDRNFFA